MKYERILTPAFLELLKPGGPMVWLLRLARPTTQNDSWALDVQLRRESVVMFYHGTTCVLRVRHERAANLTRVSFSADKAYGRSGQPSEAAYAALMGKWPVEKSCSLDPICRAYLEAVLGSASERYYKNRKEGFWQNRLAVRFGRMFTLTDEWLIIDRECVIKMGRAPEARQVITNIIAHYEKLSVTIQRENRARFGSDSIHFGNELDFLAITRDGELACVELKHGENASGIYWAPLQVSVY